MNATLPNIRLPRAIPDRPVVRIVHPSGTLVGQQAALEEGATALEKAGCAVRWDHKRAQECWRGYLAGSDEARLDEFQRALNEKDVDIIWCARGGSGLNRIAGGIVSMAEHVPPTCLVGFSDITGILTPLAQNAGWLTFHGPVVTSLERSQPTTDLSECLAIMRGAQERLEIGQQDNQPSINGQLLGGNLTVLASMVGTKTSPKPQPGAIWLLEDTGEAPYRIDRSFNQLTRVGLFDETNVIWVGDLGFDDVEVQRLMVERLRNDAPCPVFSGAPAGHVGILRLLPLGAHVSLDFERGELSSNHPWVHREKV